jgi:putative ABC transport system permease protein
MKPDRWYRALLRLLPLDFRADYGDEMARAFREQRHDAGGRIGVARVWWQNIAALLAIGPREHLAQLSQDVRYALRGMRRTPGLVIVALLTLALGIGANTAIFSIVHAVMLRPLPYAADDSLVSVWNRWAGSETAALSEPEYLDYAEGSRTMRIAAATGTNVNLSGGGRDAERAQGALISVNALEVLGVPPALGRPFAAEEERRGGRVVLISDALWKRRFAADPAVIGQPLTVNGSPHEIIGVLPSGFLLPIDFGSAPPAEVLLPLTLDRAAPRNRRGGHYLRGFGRLAPGESAASASAEMAGILQPLMREYPDQHNQGNFGITVLPLREDLLGGSRDALLVLTAAVGLVLLLACANVANLMLARGESRRRELAVRAALGASRLRVARQLLTESCVLACGGALGGVAVGYVTERAVTTFGAASFPRLAQAGFDLPVLLFTAAIAVVAGLAFGTVPALQVSHPSTDALSEGNRGGGGGRSRVRRALVVCQVAMAVVLIVGAGLLIKSFMRLIHVPSGIDPERVLTLRVSLPAARYPGRSDITAFFDRFLERVNGLPGVRVAGASSGLPLAIASGDWSFDIEGRPRVNGRRPGAADWYVVTPGYFEALGIRLVRGRLLTASDAESAPPAILINEATARALFSGEEPIGTRILLSQNTGPEQPWRTIAGVVSDVRQRSLDSPPRTEIYIPHRQFLHFSRDARLSTMSVAIKTDMAPASLAPAVRGALRSLDPEVPAAQVRDMHAVLSQSVSDWRLNAVLIGAFGGLALALAAIGLYGVMAFEVVQRKREIGVRQAMGATRGAVMRMIVRQGLALIATGVVIGMMAAVPAAGLAARLLFEVSPRDLSILASVPFVLLIVGALASYLPARRAMRVDPVIALRAD